MSKKILVAYFSCSGITEAVANKVQEMTNADLFAIRAKEPYVSADLDWTDMQSRSSVEMNNPAARPAIANRVENMDQYDIVFVGYPIWWYVAPRIIDTFMESYDFSGKTIVPFCTSGGSPVGKSDLELHTHCKAAVWKPGMLLDRFVTNVTLANWIKSLELQEE